MSTRAQGANATLLLGFESAYGTPPDNGYVKAPFVTSTLGGDQPLIEDDTLGFGRDPLPPSYGPLTVDGDVVVPLDLRTIGVWLKGLLGAPVTTDGAGDALGAKVHAWTSGAAALPSLTAEVGNPEVPSYRRHFGAMVGSWRLPIQTTGTVSTTFTLLGQGESGAAATIDATPKAHVYTRFQAGQGSVLLDGTPIGTLMGGEVSYSNNLDGFRPARDDDKLTGIDLGKAACTGNAKVRFADTTMMDKARGKTPMALTFRYRIAATAALAVTIPEVYLPRPRISIQGPAGIDVDYAWQASRTTAGNPMMTVVLVNDVTGY